MENAMKLSVKYKFLNDNIKIIFMVLLFFIVVLILWSNK
jgi:ascorbate-specific PTS system EIIC-type component UlaA